MNNRFDHLKKNRLSTDMSREEFIENAEKEDKFVQAKLKPSKKDILLSVSGRINREKNCGKPNLIYIKKELESEIKKYCHGNKTLIINFLLKKGLNALIEENRLILHMEEDDD
jgi:hypothetical protein